MRPTPFSLVFADLAVEQFPLIAAALQQNATDPADRDRFVLLEPVGRLLRSILPEGAGADALEAHVLLLHHAFLYWAAGERVYSISDHLLRRAVAETRITTELPYKSLYLQVPELRVWGSPNAAAPPEPLDGLFVSKGLRSGAIEVLAIFGMRPDRPGFSAVGLVGRADTEAPGATEIEIAAEREDGSAPFGPKLAGGTAAGLYSVGNAGELLLLTTRLLTLLDSGAPHEDESRGGSPRA